MKYTDPDNDRFFRMTVAHGVDESSDEDWKLKNEGRLSIDVAQDETHIFVIATMAGSVASEIDVSIHNDVLTIRGKRVSPLSQHVDEYYYQECFWGDFSRTVVLPADVKSDVAQAEYKNGILTVKIPKRGSGSRIPVEVVDE